MADLPRLFHFRVSHYNEKARWALDFKGCRHVRQGLIPGFHIPKARSLSGQNKVPILVMDDRAIAGSSQIIAELERRFPDPPLYPADPQERQRALEIESVFDEDIAPDMRRLFWSTYFPHPAACARLATDGFSGSARAVWRAAYPVLRPLLVRNMGADAERVAAARERLPGHFDRLESEIGPSGYLVGDRFSVADLAAAAVMTAIIRPPQFSYPLPEPWPDELTALRESIANRAGFRWVLDVCERHRGVSSEADP